MTPKMCRATGTLPLQPVPPCGGWRGNWASNCAVCGRPAPAAASRPKTCGLTCAKRTSKWPPRCRAASRRRLAGYRRVRRRADREDVANAADDRPQHDRVVHDDSPAHEFRRCRRHRAGGHARAEQGGLRRPRHQAHVAAVFDQGRRLVAQAAPDAQRLGRHGREPRSSTRST